MGRLASLLTQEMPNRNCHAWHPSVACKLEFTLNEYPSLAAVALNDMSNGTALCRANTAHFIIGYQLENRVPSGQWSKSLGRRAGGHREIPLHRQLVTVKI